MYVFTHERIGVGRRYKIYKDLTKKKKKKEHFIIYILYVELHSRNEGKKNKKKN